MEVSLVFRDVFGSTKRRVIRGALFLYLFAGLIDRIFGRQIVEIAGQVSRVGRHHTASAQDGGAKAEACPDRAPPVAPAGTARQAAKGKRNAEIAQCRGRRQNLRARSRPTNQLEGRLPGGVRRANLCLYALLPAPFAHLLQCGQSDESYRQVSNTTGKVPNRTRQGKMQMGRQLEVGFSEHSLCNRLCESKWCGERREEKKAPARCYLIAIKKKWFEVHASSWRGTIMKLPHGSLMNVHTLPFPWAR